MDIKDNLDLLNTLISVKRLSQKERYKIIKLAEVSDNLQDLEENYRWEY